MQRSEAQVRADLLAEAEALIDELLAWQRAADAPNLTEMEDQVLVLRQRLGQRLLAAVISEQEARQPAEPPCCPRCGATLRYKGQKGTTLTSRLGDVTVERGYYYCARCESGLFPPECAVAGR
jgi:hypothetical protein